MDTETEEDMAPEELFGKWNRDIIKKEWKIAFFFCLPNRYDDTYAGVAVGYP